MILCCGENLIDVVPINKSSDSYKICVGGSPLNTALGLGVLKTPVYFFSRISRDFFGKKIIFFLNKKNVNTSLCQRTKDLTTIGFVSKKTKPEFSIYANNSADRNLKTYKFSLDFKKKLSLTHFSSISLVLKPGSETYYKMMKDLKKYSLISIDPNIRPQLIDNKLNYKKKFNNFLKIADLIKMSDNDFNFLFPRSNPDKIIPQWIKTNKITFIVFTKGSKGSTLYTKNFQININPIKVKVSDTVGAGDIFHSGMLSFLYKKRLLTKHKLENLSKQTWVECLNFATKAAAINCMREGCNPPSISEIKKL